jgi:signal transduction histidine kinase
VLGPWFQPLAVILIAYLLLTLVIYLIRFYTNKGNDRIRLQYIGAGLIVMLFISAVGGVILPFFDNYDYFLTAPVSALLVFVTLATLAVIQHDLIDVRIIITEVFVFLAAGLVLVNNLVNSDNHLQLITTSFILAMFLFTAFRLTTMILNILKQRRALNSANVKMKELMDMKTEFLQIASHQLRAPLTSLHGLVQMEATGYFDDLSVNKRDEFRKQMLSSVDRLHELVNDLLKTLRLEGEKIPLKFATMDLTKVISDAIVTLKPNYEKRGLYVKFEEPKNKIIAIEGDIEYLRQVFVNIIDNAERYTTKGGITVSIKEGNGTVEVSVQDTGIGISPEEQGLLFQKFSRGCRAQQLRNEGTGLGLFIARKIVEEHHGLLLLTSPGIDKGTTATVKLPVKQPQASAAKNDPEPQTSDEPSK